MIKIDNKPLLTIFFFMFVIYGPCSVAFSKTAEKLDPIIEKSCSDLDLENLVLAQDLAQCRQEQEAQVLKARHLEDKVSQLDDQNKKIQALTDQITSIKADNEKLVRFNARLQSDSEAAARTAQKDLEQKSELLVEARLEKDLLFKKIKDLEAGKAVIEADNQKLLKINAELGVKRDAPLRKAEQIVQRHAKAIVQPYSQRVDLQKALKGLESDKAALKAENENLLKAKALLEAKSKDLFLRVNDIDYRAKGYDGLSKAMQKLNQETVRLKKENGSLKTKLDVIKKDLNKERASLYREMGAAAAQAGLVKEAVNVYQLSLKLDPNDPMTHYYLGLLYSKQWHDADALLHFKKYLALVPMAENRKEVEYFMTIMLNRSDLAIK